MPPHAPGALTDAVEEFFRVRLATLFSHQFNELLPADALVLPHVQHERGVSAGALMLGLGVFQSRYLCHDFMGSWKWNRQGWRGVWALLRHRVRAQSRQPCTFAA